MSFFLLKFIDKQINVKQAFKIEYKYECENKLLKTVVKEKNWVKPFIIDMSLTTWFLINLYNNYSKHSKI